MDIYYVLHFRIHVRSPKQRHLRSNLRDQIEVDLRSCNLRLLVLASKLGHDFAPGVDDHRMTVAYPLFIMRSSLRCCNYVRLSFNRSCTQ